MTLNYFKYNVVISATFACISGSLAFIDIADNAIAQDLQVASKEHVVPQVVHQTILPGQVAFFAISGHGSDVPANFEQFLRFSPSKIDNRDLKPLQISKWSLSNDDGWTVWYAVVDHVNQDASPTEVQILSHDREHENRVLVFAPLPEDIVDSPSIANAFECHARQKVQQLVLQCLEGKRVSLNEESTHILNSQLIDAHDSNLVYAREANYVVGKSTFQSIMEEVNNDGPVGAYKDCYEPLRNAISDSQFDPITIDSVTF